MSVEKNIKPYSKSSTNNAMSHVSNLYIWCHMIVQMVFSFLFSSSISLSLRTPYSVHSTVLQFWTFPFWYEQLCFQCKFFNNSILWIVYFFQLLSRFSYHQITWWNGNYFQFQSMLNFNISPNTKYQMNNKWYQWKIVSIVHARYCRIVSPSHMNTKYILRSMKYLP